MTRVGGWLSREKGRYSARVLVDMARLTAEEWGMGVVRESFGVFAAGERSRSELPLRQQPGKLLLWCGEDEASVARICYEPATEQLTLTSSEDGSCPLYYEQSIATLWFSSDPACLPGQEPIKLLPAGRRALFVWKA